ncbi:sigma factor-like helix-turn-helix DNA-binding protein [Streptomyces sp. NPDC090127]|uniref:sigma factor-like helix-turn-helix DNA-binding protein n=1 Tax=Streptomyces sp. NPDC090127 TaxID=3365953 RepID=UPI0037F95B78
MPSPKERRRLREAKGLTEDQVAEAMGVTRATVRSWETGRTTPRGRKQDAYAKLIGAYESEDAPGSTPDEPQPAPMLHQEREQDQEQEQEKARSRERARKRGRERERESAEPARPLAAKPTAGKPSANTRPRAATKRAAKPPKAPAAAALGIGSGTGLSSDQPASGSHSGSASDSGPAPGSGSGSGSASGTGTGTDTDTDTDTVSDPGQQAPRPVRAGASGAQQPLERRESVETSPAPTRERASHEPEPDPELAAPQASAEPVELPLTPEQAFDALYAHAAPGLVHQTYLLTGRRRLSRESVEHAFHHAWEHWPEVAVDRDPVGWVRAAAYEYALSPWHRLRRSHKHPDAPPTEAGRRNLLAALLELPPPYRRTVLLYDGLGLDLPDTAAETEASTPAAANRLLHARTVIAERVPELADPEALQRRLASLVAEAPTATLADARTVRSGSDRRARLWTRAVLGVTAALIGATAFTVATAPTQYLPVIHPGESVIGVPERGGSPKLTPQDVRLRDTLRSQPHHGPERLVPAPH